jgi:hypothetical protein
MSLEWLVAVTRPHDVMGNQTTDPTHSQELAAIITGQYWRVKREHLDSYTADDLNEESPLPHWAIQLMQESSLNNAIESASNHLRRQPVDARSVCLSLLLAAAAAEVEELERALEVLSEQLSALDGRSSGDEQFLRCALLLQIGLRSRDAGKPYTSWYELALKSAGLISVDACSPFPTRSLDPVSYQSSLVELVDAFRDAAIESRDYSTRITANSKQRIRGIDTLQRIETHRANRLVRFLDRTFSRTLKSQAVQIIGHADNGDLYHGALAFELIGHPYVYTARRDLAEIRLVNAATTDERHQLSDALRLLRHAGASKELGLALRWLRTGGPLEALSRDARLVIRFCLTPGRLRTVELQVLEAAAELLAPYESELAIDAILAALQDGPPSDLPNHQHIETIRYEAAWKALAALAESAADADRVATYLREIAEKLLDHPEELRDRAIASAIRRLNWSVVTSDAREPWVSWFVRVSRIDSHAVTASRSAISGILGLRQPEFATETPAELERITAALNSHYRRPESELPSVLRSAEAIGFVVSSLAEISERASRGSHSFGGISPAEVAAGIIDVSGEPALWGPLTEFLIDPRVARDDKSASFERLARSIQPVPETQQRQFAVAARDILESRSMSVFDSEIDPYPAALRFLSSRGIIPTDYALSCIAQLGGSSNPRSREEAATTLALLSTGETSRPQWCLPLAIQLSYDDDVEVRARAARVLSAFTQPDNGSGTATSRLMALLTEDGLSLPVQILGGLEIADTARMSEELRETVSSLAVSHPSRAIRARARYLLEGR